MSIMILLIFFLRLGLDCANNGLLFPMPDASWELSDLITVNILLGSRDANQPAKLFPGYSCWGLTTKRLQPPQS